MNAARERGDMRKNSAALGREELVVTVTPFMFASMFRAMSAAFREPLAPLPTVTREPLAPLPTVTREGVLGGTDLRTGSEYGMTFIKLRI